MKALTQEQLLDLGIELVAALQANLYNTTLEEGRKYALDETEVDEESEEYQNPEIRDRYVGFVEFQRERLHQQALLLANTAVAKIQQLAA